MSPSEGQHMLDDQRGRMEMVWTRPEEGQGMYQQKDAEDGTNGQENQQKTRYQTHGICSGHTRLERTRCSPV